MAEATNPLLELIREQGLVDDLQYEEALSEHKRSGESIFQILQNFGIMDADSILQAEANYLSAEVVSLRNRDISKDVLKLFPGAQARALECIPVDDDGSTVKVAVVDPLNPSRMDEIGYVMKRDVQLVIADPGEIKKAIEKYYADDGGGNFADLLKEIGGDEEIQQEVKQLEEQDDETIMAQLADAAPIVKFVNMVLFQAVKDRASDIHFEPFETEFRIRYRVDGALYEMSPPPKHLALPVVSRIKVMANLNISERRLPQDGRINVQMGHKSIDLRVSCLPTQFGESVVLRVLDRSAVNLELESLGFPKEVHEYVTDIIQRPNGIFVVTGPTGSGKTTTLYSCLRRVNTLDSKLLTAEDPVEYDLEGVM